jgi:hypothetical protein
VGFLRRLFGGGGSGPASTADRERDERRSPPTVDEIAAEERAHELELLREEQERLGDLVLRQQRYADRSWVPPKQGGERRADDVDGDASGGSGRSA